MTKILHSADAGVKWFLTMDLDALDFAFFPAEDEVLDASLAALRPIRCAMQRRLPSAIATSPPQRRYSTRRRLR